MFAGLIRGDFIRVIEEIQSEGAGFFLGDDCRRSQMMLRGICSEHVCRGNFSGLEETIVFAVLWNGGSDIPHLHAA